MMTKCPEYGSTEIVADLIVFSDSAGIGQNPPFVKLVEPEPAKRPFVWMPKDVKAGFRAAVCGACGYTQFYTNQHAELLEAHKKGYTTQPYMSKILLPP
jgi:hypothetical protein